MCRDELVKRRRNIGADSQTTQPSTIIPQNIDFESYSIEEAINYQKSSGIDL